MNQDYFQRAKEKIPDAKKLITISSTRAKHLAGGARPMIKCDEKDFLNIALLEIAEGKISIDEKSGRTAKE
jgi:DNA-directed RNA polymerase subunit K/omega